MSIYDDMAQMFLARQQAQQQIPYQLGQPVQQLQQQPYSYQNLLKAFDLMRSMSEPSRQPRQPVIRPDGVAVFNRMTQEEKDLINHPSVQWLKKQSEESRRQFETEMMPYLGKKYTLPNNWEADNGEDPNKFVSTMPYRVDPEYARHAEIVGELAKRNPNVLYEAGILNRGISRYAPGEFNQEIPDERLTNPMRNSLSVF